LPATTKGGIAPGFYTPMLVLNGGNFHDAIWRASNQAAQDPVKAAKDARREAEDAADRKREAELAAALKAQALRDAEDVAAKAKASADAIRKSAAADAAKKAADDVAKSAEDARKTANEAADKARSDAATAAATAGASAKKAADLGLPAGEVVRSENRHGYRNDTIHFTFSVGTPTSKAQLAANLVQDNTSDDKSSVEHGTVTGNQAIITAVLTAGAAVVDAEVFGYAQVIDEGTDAIPTFDVNFNDKGQWPDKVKDDGIYTAAISLPVSRPKPAEYRVFIEGRSDRDKTKFVPSGEVGLVSAASKLASQPDATDPGKGVSDRPAPGFQRATSINFFVPSNAINQ
jgi:hypothetical protein